MYIIPTEGVPGVGSVLSRHTPAFAFPRGLREPVDEVGV
jgi:hypothetical protein